MKVKQLNEEKMENFTEKQIEETIKTMSHEEICKLYVELYGNLYQKEQFEPIKLEITIESQKELDDLYYRLYVDDGDDFDEATEKGNIDTVCNIELYVTLENIKVQLPKK